MYQFYEKIPVIDHIKKTSTYHWLVFPPKLDKETILDYLNGQEGLKTCDDKLGELLKRQELVKTTFKNNVSHIKAIAQQENWNEISSYFWLYYESARATELSYIKRWIYYWLKIVDVIRADMHKKPIFNKKNGITDMDIDRAKEYPITELYNGTLKQNYNRHVGLCPFHKENTPSFTIFENNRYFCFGCGAKGSSIDFVMQTQGLNFVDAVKELCRL